MLRSPGHHWARSETHSWQFGVSTLQTARTQTTAPKKTQGDPNPRGPQGLSSIFLSTTLARGEQQEDLRQGPCELLLMASGLF